MQLVQSRLRLTVVVLLAGTSAGVLTATPPRLSAAMWSRGDDLALAAAWTVALAACIWLFVASAACLLAIGARRPRLARSLSRALPPALRRAVEVAVVTSCLAVSAAPAHAANRTAEPLVDQPVVRAPRSLAVTPTTTIGAPSPMPPSTRPAPARTSTVPSTSPPAPTTTTATIAPPAEPRATDPGASSPTPAVAPSVAPAPPTAPSDPAARIVVRPGDNLWVIARTELVRRTGAYPNDGQVARYWQAVIDANRETLRSGDPGLIFPGEIVALPPAPPVS